MPNIYNDFLNSLRIKRKMSSLLQEMGCVFNAPIGNPGWEILTRAQKVPEYCCHVISPDDLIGMFTVLQMREDLFVEFCQAVDNYYTYFNADVSDKIKSCLLDIKANG